MGNTLPHVVIIGAGFGGLYAAKALARKAVRVTIVDRTNHHTFQPLLYQVATAGISPGEIAAPIRRVMRRHKNVEVLLGEVTGFDLKQRRVVLRDVKRGAAGPDVFAGARPPENASAESLKEHFEIPYDYLIVAAGATHAYFGHEEWQYAAPGLKTVEDAIEIRRRILLAYELAERRKLMGEEPLPLNFFVVGGGPTGVELAGALAEIANQTVVKDFREIDTKGARIVLLEGAPRLLPPYPEDLSRSAKRQLENLGVEVRTGVTVTGIEPGKVIMGDRAEPAAVILWAAGVLGSPLGRILGEATGAEVDRAGRVKIRPDLSLPGHPEVFVIGDLANLAGKDGNPVPWVAPAAIQQGKAAAASIVRDLKSLPRKEFHYFDKGSLATIGRASGVADFGKHFHISGLIAWLAYLFVHIFFLIGFRNRLVVLIEWAWAYLTYDRGARLITGSNELPGWKDY